MGAEPPREVAGSHCGSALRSSLVLFALQTARSPRTRGCATLSCPTRSLPRGASPRNPTLPRLPMAPPSQRRAARAASVTGCPSLRISGDLPRPPSRQVGPGRAALSEGPAGCLYGCYGEKSHGWALQICPFHSFLGCLFRVAFAAHLLLLREQRVTGCRKVVMPSAVDFFCF